MGNFSSVSSRKDCPIAHHGILEVIGGGGTVGWQKSCFLKSSLKALGHPWDESILADDHSYIPTGILATHIFAVGYLSVVVVRTMYRSYIVLPPSSATRYREPLRQGYVHAFSLLALASLAVAAYFDVTFSSLSYQVWATERGVELPTRLESRMFDNHRI